MLAVMAMVVPPAAFAQEEKKDESFIKVPVGLLYASAYWWRGIEFNGKGNGVLWPSVGVLLGDTGLSLNFAAGINMEDAQAEGKSARHPAKATHEFDYGAAYSRDLGELVTAGAGIMFIHYPYYDNVYTNDTSFLEGSVFVMIKTILSPRLDVYYDYYIEENADAGKDTPQAEDVYVKLSCAQDIIKDDGFAFSTGLWIGYYNNAYLDLSGFSDLGIKLGTSKDYRGIVFSAGVYYARTLAKDFYDYYAASGGVRQKNHFWADFGATCTF